MRPQQLILGALLGVAVPRHAEAEEPVLQSTRLPRNKGASENEPHSGIARDGCDTMPIWGVRTGCRTPRPGVVSGGYLGVDLGLASLKSSAAQRAGVGVGPAFQLRFGIEFFDQFLLGVSIGTYGLHDKRPFSQTVINCEVVTNNCSAAEQAETSVAAGFATAEVGYQTRFRPALNFSLTPGLTLGYLQSFVSLNRSIDCLNCKSEDLHLDESGAYVAPFFRVTFDRLGWVAAVVRSQWFFRSDIKQMTFIGGELFLP